MGAALACAGAAGIVAGLITWQALLLATRRALAQSMQRRLRRIKTEIPNDLAPAGLKIRKNRYSDLPKLRRFISRLSVTARVLPLLEQAGSSLNASAYLLLHGCCAAIALLAAGWFHMPPAASVVIVAAAGLAPLFVMRAKRRKRFHRLSEQLPEAIRLVASAMRAGFGLDVGLSMVAAELGNPIAAEFRTLVNEARLYADMNEAMRRLAARAPMADIRLFTAAASLHREIGGNFAELLEQLEQTIRSRFQLRRELKTLTAEGRFSGWILVALPVAVSLAIYSMNPGYFRVLIDDPSGRAMLWGAVILQAVGFGIIRWLVSPRMP